MSSHSNTIASDRVPPSTTPDATCSQRSTPPEVTHSSLIKQDRLAPIQSVSATNYNTSNPSDSSTRSKSTLSPYVRPDKPQTEHSTKETVYSTHGRGNQSEGWIHTLSFCLLSALASSVSRLVGMVASFPRWLKSLIFREPPADDGHAVDTGDLNECDEFDGDVDGDGTNGEDVGQQPVLEHLLQGGMGASAESPDLRAHVLTHSKTVHELPKWVTWLVQSPDTHDTVYQRPFPNKSRNGLNALGPNDGTSCVKSSKFWWSDRSNSLDGVTPRCSALGKRPMQRAPCRQVPCQCFQTPRIVRSRYQADFVELDHLGKGAFGLVVGAINRLDGRKYAVKKIPMRGDEDDGAWQRLLREVATLSSLQHANIVRYYQAWHEPADSCIHLAESESDLYSDSRFTSGTTVVLPSYNPTSSHSHSYSLSHGYSNFPDAWRPPTIDDQSPTLPVVTELSQEDSTQDIDTQPALSWNLQSPTGSLTIDAPTTTPSTQPNSTQFLHNTEVSSDLCASDSNDDDSSLSGSSLNRIFPDKWIPDHKSALYSTSAWGWDRAENEKSSTATPVHAARKRVHTELLYIQMEYCPSTVKQRLMDGPIPADQVWRLLRQLLAALAHLHSHGITHRDVKPDNVFYDARNDVKLGDFGLAKFTHSDANEGFSLRGTNIHLPDRPNLDSTTGVGTTIYMAPEISNGKASRAGYSSKVDMFSLGMMAVELWVPFNTEMERRSCLDKCRQPGGIPQEVRALITHPGALDFVSALLSHNPDQRPSATEMLQGNLLPASVGHEQITDLLRAMPDNPGMYKRVIESLFASAQTVDAGGAVVGPAVGGSISGVGEVPIAGVPHVVQDTADLARVIAAIKTTFSNHGAVPMGSTQLGYTCGDSPADTLHVLTANGVKVGLRYEVRLPFCHWLSRQAAASFLGTRKDGVGLHAMRRYEVSDVYRDDPTAPLPRAFPLADLDILTPWCSNTQERMLAVAELIKAGCDAVHTIEQLKHVDIEVHISHTDLVQAGLSHVSSDAGRSTELLQLLTTFTSVSLNQPDSRSQALPELCQSIQLARMGDGILERCVPLLTQMPTDAQPAVAWLKTVLGTPDGANSGLLECLTEIATLIDHLHAWGVISSGTTPAAPSTTVVVKPFLTPCSSYFQGTFFQVHMRYSGSVEGQQRSRLVGAGGCYDSFLQELWPEEVKRRGGSALCGSGLTLNVQELVAMALRMEQRHFSTGASFQSSRKLSASDIVVCAEDGSGMLAERMAVTQRLWGAGFAAETMHVTCPSTQQQREYTRVHGFRIIVMLNWDPDHNMTIKVTFLDTKREADVQLEKLTNFLRGQ